MLLSLSLSLTPFASDLPSFPAASEGDSRGCNFHPSAVPPPSLRPSPLASPAISPYSSAAVDESAREGIRIFGLSFGTAAEEETVPLSDSKFRFLRYQDIRILRQLPPSTRTGRRGSSLSGGRAARRRGSLAAKSFHILTTFK